MSIDRRKAHSRDMTFLCECFLRSMRDSIARSRGAWDEARERAQFEDQLDLEATTIICADGVDVGFVTLDQDPKALQIHTLCVAPEYQGRGIGSQVTIDVVDFGRETGRDIIVSVLKVNTRAEALYRQLGFVVFAETEHHHHLRRWSVTR